MVENFINNKKARIEQVALHDYIKTRNLTKLEAKIILNQHIDMIDIIVTQEFIDKLKEE